MFLYTFFNFTHFIQFKLRRQFYQLSLSILYCSIDKCTHTHTHTSNSKRTIRRTTSSFHFFYSEHIVYIKMVEFKWCLAGGLIQWHLLFSTWSNLLIFIQSFRTVDIRFSVIIIIIITVIDYSKVIWANCFHSIYIPISNGFFCQYFQLSD